MNGVLGESVQMVGICKSFPGVKALKNVSFSCKSGEIHALVGENGAGKSTLIKILGGVYQPDAGTVSINGIEHNLRSPREAQVAGVSVIHQEHSLVPYMTVAENILLGDERRNRLGLVNERINRDRARAVLESIGCEIRTGEIVANLNSTKQKLVEVAKALALEPSILVVDEPTASLGKKETDLFFAALGRLRDDGVSIVYISHLLDEIFQIADRVTVLKDGEYVATKETRDTDGDELIRLMIGRKVGELFPPKSKDINENKVPILSLQHLQCGNELRDVSLSLNPGEILGIAGLEGNGQGSLLRAVFGALDLDSGTILIDGKPIRISKPSEAIRAGIALVTEDRAREGLCLQLSVTENLALPTLRKRQTMGILSQNREEKMVKQTVSNLNIKTTSFANQVQFLSGGNQQKVVIGKWLNAEPRIILFIEPTLGIDVGAKADVYQLIRKLAEERGKGVIVVTSDMLELLGLCDRILVMYQGQVVADIPRETATEEKITKAAVGR